MNEKTDVHIFAAIRKCARRFVFIHTSRKLFLSYLKETKKNQQSILNLILMEMFIFLLLLHKNKK